MVHRREKNQLHPHRGGGDIFVEMASWFVAGNCVFQVLDLKGFGKNFCSLGLSQLVGLSLDLGESRNQLVGMNKHPSEKVNET